MKTYKDWVASLPKTITDDSLWKIEAYRLSLFSADIAWHDVTKLMSDRRTVRIADQLYRAVGSVSANIAEGYSRMSKKEKARFYEYSLGSAREARDWYYKSRHLLGSSVIEHRLELLTTIIRLLIVMVPNQRNSPNTVRENTTSYHIDRANDTNDEPIPFA